MTLAGDLLAIATTASEATRKDGFTIGAVTVTLNGTSDTVTVAATIPVEISIDSTTQALTVAAKDFLTPPAWAA